MAEETIAATGSALDALADTKTAEGSILHVSEDQSNGNDSKANNVASDAKAEIANLGLDDLGETGSPDRDGQEGKAAVEEKAGAGTSEADVRADAQEVDPEGENHARYRAAPDNTLASHFVIY